MGEWRGRWLIADMSDQSNHRSLAIRWSKLNRRISEQGIQTLPGITARWVYWNTGVRPLADRVGLKPKKFGIKQPIIVFQVGKVGSTSVYVSLQRLNLDVPVYHQHFLRNLGMLEEWAQRSLNDPSAEMNYLANSRELNAMLARKNPPRFNLISLVRAPIPRRISNFFHYINVRIPNFDERYNANQLTGADVADFFVNHYKDNMHDTWFDEQIKEVFGLDVYAEEFLKERGYKIFERENVRLLLLRMEDLNRCAPEAMREYLNIPNFRLVRTNVGEEKAYGTLYRDFLSALRLPPEYVAETHERRYSKHFYTPEELAASVARWTEPAL